MTLHYWHQLILLPGFWLLLFPPYLFIRLTNSLRRNGATPEYPRRNAFLLFWMPKCVSALEEEWRRTDLYDTIRNGTAVVYTIHGCNRVCVCVILLLLFFWVHHHAAYCGLVIHTAKPLFHRNKSKTMRKKRGIVYTYFQYYEHEEEKKKRIKIVSRI